MASRRRGKGRRKVGRKSAGCAAGSVIARNDPIVHAARSFRSVPSRSHHADRSLVGHERFGEMTEPATGRNRKLTAMKCWRSSFAEGAVAAAVLLGLSASPAARGDAPEIAPVLRQPRVFPASVFSMDGILARPFDREVPMGCTGDRVWASSPQGWAFRDDVHWLYLTNLNAFDLEIRDEYGLLGPASATYYPSHVHYDRALRKELTAAASFTFVLDNVDNPLRAPYRAREALDLLVERFPERLVRGRTSACRARSPASMCSSLRTLRRAVVGRPDSLEIRSFRPELAGWSSITPSKSFPARPRPGENRVRFQPVRSRRFRLEFRNAADRFYTGIYGLKPIYEDDAPGRAPESARDHVRQVHHLVRLPGFSGTRP